MHDGRGRRRDGNCGCDYGRLPAKTGYTGVILIRSMYYPTAFGTGIQHGMTLELLKTSGYPLFEAAST